MEPITLENGVKAFKNAQGQIINNQGGLLDATGGTANATPAYNPFPTQSNTTPQPVTPTPSATNIPTPSSSNAPATPQAPTPSPMASQPGNFANQMQIALDRLQSNNEMVKQRQLLMKQLYDTPLSPAELVSLPQPLQAAIATGNKDEMEMQLRLLNDNISGRNATLNQSVQYLTTQYNNDVALAEKQRQDAINTVLQFGQTYGSQAPQVLQSLYGPQYVQQLQDMGIDLNSFANAQTVAEQKNALQYGNGSTGSQPFDVVIPQGTIASQTNNPLNIKYVEGNELGGLDSGIQATDGGTFASFNSPYAGLIAAQQLLSSPTYNNLTVNQALQKWSNGGYGAEISSLNPNQNMSSLSPDQLTQLVTDMAERESGTQIQIQPTDVQINAQGLLDGTIPPSLIPAYGKLRGQAVAEAKREDPTFNESQAELDYQAAKKWVTAINGPQMIRFQGLAGSVVNTIDEVRNKAQEMQQGGITGLNYLQLQKLVQLQGNTPQGQLAAQYLAAVNTLKEEFANLANGGYAPTDAAWSLANAQINSNYGVDELDSSLSEVQRLINYRINAIGSVQPVSTPGSNTFDTNSAVVPSGASATTQDVTSILEKYGIQ